MRERKKVMATFCVYYPREWPFYFIFMTNTVGAGDDAE